MEQLSPIRLIEHELGFLVRLQMLEVAPVSVQVVFDGAIRHYQYDKLFVRAQQIGWHVACIEGIIEA